MKVHCTEIAVLAVMALGLCGCSTGGGTKTDEAAHKPEYGTIGAHEDMAVSSCGRPMGENMLQSFRDGEYERFAKDMDESRRKKFTRQQFEHMRRQMVSNMGEIKSVRFLTTLNQTMLRDFIWQVSFEKKDPKTGAVATREMLFRVIVGKLDGKYSVLGFGFN